jgi:hypothetical protein
MVVVAVHCCGYFVWQLAMPPLQQDACSLHEERDQKMQSAAWT